MILPIIICMLLFYIIYFYGYWVANSIVAEKIASFYISSFFVTKFINSQAKILDISLLLSEITAADILWIIIFFVLGYTLYAIFNALAGVTVSKLEDLNVALMPVSFIIIICCYLAMFGISSPDSLVGKIATIILLVFLTSRVYSVVILQTGNRVTILDLFSIFKKIIKPIKFINFKISLISLIIRGCSKAHKSLH